MKKNFYKSCFFVALATGLVFTSCTKDEAKQEEVKPQFSLGSVVPEGTTMKELEAQGYTMMDESGTVNDSLDTKHFNANSAKTTFPVFWTYPLTNDIVEDLSYSSNPSLAILTRAAYLYKRNYPHSSFTKIAGITSNNDALHMGVYRNSTTIDASTSYYILTRGPITEDTVDDDYRSMGLSSVEYENRTNSDYDFGGGAGPYKITDINISTFTVTKTGGAKLTMKLKLPWPGDLDGEINASIATANTQTYQRSIEFTPGLGAYTIPVGYTLKLTLMKKKNITTTKFSIYDAVKGTINGDVGPFSRPAGAPKYFNMSADELFPYVDDNVITIATKDQVKSSVKYAAIMYKTSN